MESSVRTTVTTGNGELVAERVLDAPRELVWKAWTDPEQVVVWWGPDGFTNTNQEMAVRPGGVWRFTMHGPDGTDYPNRIIFREVVKPERLVYDHTNDTDDDPHAFRATATFEDVGGGKTKVTMRAIFEDPEELKRRAAEFGAIEGAEQHLGRLAAFLAERADRR